MGRRELADTTTHPQPVRRQLVRHLINTSILIGGGVAALLSLTTYFQRGSILKGLTSSAPVREASALIFPVVLITQTLKGLAYPVNGIVMGGLDWIFSMLAMWAANLACVGLVRGFAMQGPLTLGQIWWALAAFMGTQVVVGILRYESKTGVWKVLGKENNSNL
jgi:Na+-driven multidrug efflux pump